MMTPEFIKERITAGLKCDHIEVTGDDGQHFEALVVSPEFEGVSMLAQHRLVYATIDDLMKSEAIHALSLKTYATSAWS